MIKQNSNKTRREEDLLGELEIDNDVYYGIHTQRAINNFKISNSKILDYPLFIKPANFVLKLFTLAKCKLEHSIIKKTISLLL